MLTRLIPICKKQPNISQEKLPILLTDPVLWFVLAKQLFLPVPWYYTVRNTMIDSWRQLLEFLVYFVIIMDPSNYFWMCVFSACTSIWMEHSYMYLITWLLFTWLYIYPWGSVNRKVIHRLNCIIKSPTILCKFVVGIMYSDVLHATEFKSRYTL